MAVVLRPFLFRREFGTPASQHSDWAALAIAFVMLLGIVWMTGVAFGGDGNDIDVERIGGLAGWWLAR